MRCKLDGQQAYADICVKPLCHAHRQQAQERNVANLFDVGMFVGHVSVCATYVGLVELGSVTLSPICLKTS